MSTFLIPRRNFIKIDDNEEYQRVTVQIHGKGIILRDKVLGGQVKTKKQQLTKPYDLIVAEIDAKVGGFGIISPHLANSIVSNHYFLYEINKNIVDPDFLSFYLKTGKPTADLLSKGFVKGSHNYASIRAEHFLELEMPIPPLNAQHDLIELQNNVIMLQNIERSIKQGIDSILRSTYEILYETSN